MKTDIRDIIYNRFIKFTYIFIFFIIIIDIMNFYHNDMTNIVIDTILISVFIINLKIKSSKESKIFLLLLMGMIFFIFIIYNGSIHSTGWLFILTFSAFAFLLNNKRGGITWTLLFGVILFSILLLQFYFNINTAYTNHEMLILLSVYVMNAYLMYIFQKEVDLYTSKLTKLNSSLESKVLEEVKKNKEKEAILSKQAKQAQMGEMVSMIAHQWRQPLNAISASAIKMKLENDMGMLTSTHINKTSDFIQDKTQDMSEIINSFLEFSKPISKDSEFLLSHAINKVQSIVETQFKLNAIDIEINYKANFIDNIIVGAENLFEQVLLNLLMNIRDAFDENQEIMKKNIIIFIDNFSDIEIKDNAGGINSQIIDKVFNPYFTTKEEGKGTGLGLYMSRKIMRTHFNGDLIYSPTSGGSCFKIIFNKIQTKE